MSKWMKVSGREKSDHPVSLCRGSITCYMPSCRFLMGIMFWNVHLYRRSQLFWNTNVNYENIVTSSQKCCYGRVWACQVTQPSLQSPGGAGSLLKSPTERICDFFVLGFLGNLLHPHLGSHCAQRKVVEEPWALLCVCHFLLPPLFSTSAGHVVPEHVPRSVCLTFSVFSEVGKWMGWR